MQEYEDAYDVPETNLDAGNDYDTPADQQGDDNLYDNADVISDPPAETAQVGEACSGVRLGYSNSTLNN